MIFRATPDHAKRCQHLLFEEDFAADVFQNPCHTMLRYAITNEIRHLEETHRPLLPSLSNCQTLSVVMHCINVQTTNHKEHLPCAQSSLTHTHTSYTRTTHNMTALDSGTPSLLHIHTHTRALPYSDISPLSKLSSPCHVHSLNVCSWD